MECVVNALNKFGRLHGGEGCILSAVKFNIVVC